MERRSWGGIFSQAPRWCGWISESGREAPASELVGGLGRQSTESAGESNSANSDLLTIWRATDSLLVVTECSQPAPSCRLGN